MSSFSTDTYNGARCKSYSWTQSHGDLEVRIRIDKSIKNEEIDVNVTKRDICVEILRATSGLSIGSIDESYLSSKILMKGDFEHRVDTESIYWLIEEEQCQNYIVIYIDKTQDRWWKQLLINEEILEQGSRNYTVPMDQLDGSSRMVIDRLVKEQQGKKLNHNPSSFDFDSLA